MQRISSGFGPRPGGGGFETFSWYFFRISGVVLILLIAVHMIIMHVSNDVHCTTYLFVSMRYSNPFWRLFDWLLLTLGLTHGLNGLRVVIDDYVRSASARVWLLSIVGLLLLTFFMLGTITLVTFHAAANAGPACVGGTY